jgi:hypothetical protein
MPIAGLGLHVVVAIYFATHVLRTGQDKYWLMILFAFPLVGSLVYALTVWLPDARNSRQGTQFVRGMRQILDPSRELREAQDALDAAATPNHRIRLADALMAAARASEAVVQYQAVLTGLYADDAQLQVKLARALLEAGNPNDARVLLDRLIAEQPSFKSAEGHLVYARAVAALGDRVRTHEEYGTLVGYYAGLEARARYAEVLLGWNERDRLDALLADTDARVRHMPPAARNINREWIDRIRTVQSALKARSTV